MNSGIKFELNSFQCQVTEVTNDKVFYTFSNKAGSIKNQPAELDIKYAALIIKQQAL
jgi:hypothetical protein